MHIDKPTLFLEINDNYFVFLVVKYSDDQNYKIITHSKIVSKGLKNSKIVDVKTSSILIKDNIEKIEKEINYIFRDINIISDLNSIRCINVSGFKKLNGSQVLEENVTYIMNNLKKSIMKNELEFTLIHLFNSKYFLDKIETTNLPVGLYGNLYQHEMTFFLLPKVDIKNIKTVLNKCNLNVDRIILKSFTEGIFSINELKNNQAFFRMHIGKKRSYISYFDNSSLNYVENFNFGSDLILKDISKVCSISLSNVENFLKDKSFKYKDENNKEKFLSEKYFTNELFRKISYSLIRDVISARSNEMIHLMYNDNPNILYLKNKKNSDIILSFEDKKIIDNLQLIFNECFSGAKNITYSDYSENDYLRPCLMASELLIRGWEKEAIPVIHTKKSLLSKIFGKIFD